MRFNRSKYFIFSAFYLLSAGLLSAATPESDEVPEATHSSPAQRAVLIPVQQEMSSQDQLLIDLTRQRDEALKKAQDAEAKTAQQAKQIAELMVRLSPHVSSQSDTESVASAPVVARTPTGPLPDLTQDIVIEVMKFLEEASKIPGQQAGILKLAEDMFTKGIPFHEKEYFLGRIRSVSPASIASYGVEIFHGYNTVNIAEIDIRNNSTGDLGVQVLAASKGFTRLSSLCLYNNPRIGYEGAYALARSKAFETITILNLNGTKIGDEGAKAIANSKAFPNLTNLQLQSNNIGDEGAQAFANSKAFSAITLLALHENNIGDQGAKAFANSRAFPNLELLILWGNSIGDFGIQALADSTTFHNLTEIQISGNRIGDEGAKALANSRAFPKLTGILLYSNKIGVTGGQALSSSPRRAIFKF